MLTSAVCKETDKVDRPAVRGNEHAGGLPGCVVTA